MLRHDGIHRLRAGRLYGKLRLNAEHFVDVVLVPSEIIINAVSAPQRSRCAVVHNVRRGRIHVGAAQRLQEGIHRFLRQKVEALGPVQPGGIPAQRFPCEVRVGGRGFHAVAGIPVSHCHGKGLRRHFIGKLQVFFGRLINLFGKRLSVCRQLSDERGFLFRRAGVRRIGEQCLFRIQPFGLFRRAGEALHIVLPVQGIGLRHFLAGRPRFLFGSRRGKDIRSGFLIRGNVRRGFRRLLCHLRIRERKNGFRRIRGDFSRSILRDLGRGLRLRFRRGFLRSSHRSHILYRFRLLKRVRN